MAREKKNTDRSEQFPAGEGVDGSSAASSVSKKASRTERLVTEKLPKALTHLQSGKHSKAVSVVRNLSSKKKYSVHSALIHRVQGFVCGEVASITNDLNTKQQHLKDAIESARKAVELSPNSIEFSHFYANLLYKAAEYQQVVQECERALAVEDPIDPAKENLPFKSNQKIPTAEGRITQLQTELGQLIQKSNVHSFWDAMSIESKKGLLKIKISDLEIHFNSSNDASANDIISEALFFYDANRTWKFWVCCDEKFVDSKSHMYHVVQKHLGNLLPKMQSILPHNIDDDWKEILLNLSRSSGVGRYCDIRNTDQVVVNRDLSLLLNECILSNEVPSDVEPFLLWIYANPTTGEQLASWAQTKDEKTRQQMEIFQMLEKEFYKLQRFCERKYEHLNYKEALESVMDFYLEERKKSDFIPKSCVSVLRKQKRKLIKAENDPMHIGSRFELYALTNVLKEVKTLDDLEDEESGEDEGGRAKDYLNQIDSCLEAAKKRLKERLCIKAHLEALAEMDVKKKSDAAREARVAELAQDSKVVSVPEQNVLHDEAVNTDNRHRDPSLLQPRPLPPPPRLQYSCGCDCFCQLGSCGCRLRTQPCNSSCGCIGYECQNPNGRRL